jgi:hypothetical protein
VGCLRSNSGDLETEISAIVHASDGAYKTLKLSARVPGRYAQSRLGSTGLPALTDLLPRLTPEWPKPTRPWR